MGIIEPEEASAIREHLARFMRSDVVLDLYREPQGPDNEAQVRLCDETERLLQEIAALSPQIALRSHCLDDGEAAARLAVRRGPVITISGAARGRVRFLGVPAGFEVGVLLESLLDVSCGNSTLTEATRTVLSGLTGDVHIQVLVTPTCKFCHPMARIAHQLAVESERVTADVIEASEFPEVLDRHDVRAVPTTIINDRLALSGLRSEADVAAALLQLGRRAEPPQQP